MSTTYPRKLALVALLAMLVSGCAHRIAFETLDAYKQAFTSLRADLLKALQDPLSIFVYSTAKRGESLSH
jgi:hypothetical protein